jgi:hypothetical protein
MRMTCLRIQLGGSLFGYHQCIKIDKAGPFFGIKWVPFVVLKTTGYIAILAFFRLRAAFVPHMKTLLVTGETAAEETTTSKPFKDRSARLTADAVVVTNSFEVLTNTHGRR